MPDSVVGCHKVEVAPHQEVLVHALTVLLAVYGELLLFVGVQPPPEGELPTALHYKLRFDFAELLPLGHLVVGLLAITLDELTQIVEADLTALIAEAKHESIEYVGLAGSIRANNGGEV